MTVSLSPVLPQQCQHMKCVRGHLGGRILQLVLPAVQEYSCSGPPDLLHVPGLVPSGSRLHCAK